MPPDPANPFDQFGTAAKPPVTPAYGVPPKAEKPKEPNPGVGYQMNPDGTTASPIPGGSADKGKEAYPQTSLDAFDRAIKSIETLRKHPGLGAAVGSAFDPAAIGSYNPLTGKAFGGTEAAGFESRLEALKAQTFLPMVQALKGMGALSDAEGKKLTASIGALGAEMPEADFLASLDEIEQQLKTYRARGAGEVGEEAPSSKIIWPEKAGGVPKGSEIEFEMDKPERSFDRDEWLKTIDPSLDRNKEANLVATLNANVGNPDITAADVAEIYRKSGFEQLPSQADMQDAAQKIREGSVRWTDYDERSAEAAKKAALDAEIERKQANPESPVATAGTEAVQGFAMGGLDELMGIIGGMNALEAGGGFGEGYERDRDVMRRRLERSEAENPTNAMISGIVGSVANPIGVNKFRAAESVGDVMKVGAMLGGAEGFLRGEGLTGSVGNAMLGAATGAPLSGGMHILGNKVSNRLTQMLGRPSQADLAAQRAGAEDLTAAADEIGATVRMADLDPALAHQRARAASSPAGAPIVDRANTQDISDLERATLGLGTGNIARDPNATGSVVQRALGAQEQSSKSLRSDTYGMVEKFAPNFRANPVQTIAAIDSAIESLARNAPRGSQDTIAALEKVKADLAETGLTVGALQAQRDVVRGLTNQTNIDMTRAESILNNVLNIAGRELEGAMRGGGKERAAQALAKANKDTAVYHEFRTQVARQLLGPDNNPFPPERTASAIEAWLRPGRSGDFERVSRMWKEMRPADRQDFASAVASNLGRNNKGEFSLPILLANLDAKNGVLSQRAAEVIFGKDGLSALRSIRKVAEAKNRAMAARNTSRTADAMGPQVGGLQRAVFSLLGFGAGDITGAATAYAGSTLLSRIGEKRLARLVTDPNVAKWINSLPATEGEVTKAIARLDQIAARSPAIAEDIVTLKEEIEKSGKQAPPVPVR